MTDIVERLRAHAKKYGIVAPDLDISEAADEIERLRAALQEIADMRYTNTSAATIAHRALQVI